MIHVLVLHGPNLNLLGEREKEIYGSLPLEVINQRIIDYGITLDMEVRPYQSNSEGVLMDTLQEARKWAAGVVINPGGYSHTSVALHDTILAIHIPVVEVHLSNIFSREEFRRRSITAAACVGSVSGFGWRSYLLGLQALHWVITTQRE